MQEAIALIESCIEDPFSDLEAALEEEKAATKAFINVTADIAELLGLARVVDAAHIVMDLSTVTASCAAIKTMPTGMKAATSTIRSVAPTHFTENIIKVTS